MCQSARADVTKYRRLGGLGSETYFLKILEIGSPTSRCWQGWLLLLPVSSYGLPSVYVCILISSPYKDTIHIGLQPTLMTPL